MKPGSLWIALLIAVFVIGSIFGTHEIVQRRRFTALRADVPQVLEDFRRSALFVEDAEGFRAARAGETPVVAFVLANGYSQPDRGAYSWELLRGRLRKGESSSVFSPDDRGLVQVVLRMERKRLLLSIEIEVSFLSGERRTAPGLLLEQMMVERGLKASFGDFP